ncbi:RHS repeat-associated core domain-containing protein [Chryseobacterium camelliae]|uniref:RHS repeat-associated core domain-containing protein n=1 Tax=Chryseobacterium camelliae TaxID=1265445 RepID=UPI000C1CA439|nr:RHS repeat-associated core domain-containing protein [Chryseobacterium camelliae]
MGREAIRAISTTGRELQETGMYSYGWRDYMPDIGRWNGIDQLAESYLSTGTYAYVANNPVSNADVDGRWFNDDGSIDVSGTANGFVRTRSYTQSYLGQYPGQGGGGGGISSSNEDVISFLQDYFVNNGTVNSLFSLMDQLKGAGFKDSLNTKANFEDWQKLVENVPALNEMYSKITGVEFNLNTNLHSPGRADYYKIGINTNRISNILEYAFTIGHEMTHSFTDINFKNIFFELIPYRYGQYMRDNAYTFFKEAVGVGWEINYGQTRYGSLNALQAVRKYYIHIDERAIYDIEPYFNTLMREWNRVYKQKK